MDRPFTSKHLYFGLDQSEAMRVLLTGAHGRVGTAITDHLADDIGHRTTPPTGRAQPNEIVLIDVPSGTARRVSGDGGHRMELSRGGCRAMIVEWSYHMWHTDTDRYPINPDTTYDPRPLSDQTFGSDDPVGDYLDRMDEVGIDRAVLVQPEPYIGDHSLVLDCVSEDPDRLRATSYGRLYLCTGDSPSVPANHRNDVHPTV